MALNTLKQIKKAMTESPGGKFYKYKALEPGKGIVTDYTYRKGTRIYTMSKSTALALKRRGKKFHDL